MNKKFVYQVGNNKKVTQINLLFPVTLHVSGDVFAHHQEHLTAFTVSGSIHPSSCWLVSWMSLNSSKTPASSNLGEYHQIL
jgi:hypothetical protein